MYNVLPIVFVYVNIPNMGKFIDLSNKVFEKWTVLKRGPNDRQKKVQWICRCSCGFIGNIRAKTLRNGASTGCRQCQINRTFRTHGMCRSPTNKVWAGMIARCHNPNDTGYKWYGAKGIEVCQRWRDDFINFFEDMGERPPNKTIDRIDNFKGYSKKNCKWSTTKEQNSNKRHHQLSRLP